MVDLSKRNMHPPILIGTELTIQQLKMLYQLFVAHASCNAPHQTECTFPSSRFMQFFMIERWLACLTVSAE